MRRLIVFLSAAALIALAAAAPASAMFGLRDLDVTFTNEDGTPATSAGTHPFALITTVGVNTKVVPGGAVDPDTNQVVDGEVPEGELRQLTVTQIPGLIGDQTAIPRCSAADFAHRVESYPSCPDETAVGIAAVKAEFSVFPVGAEAFLHLPVYNLKPRPGVAAEFGFVAANVPITFDVALSEAPPYNLVVKLEDLPQALLFYSSQVTLWGNPADSAHDSLRGKCVGLPAEPTTEPVSKGNCPVDTAEKPLLTLPRSCQGSLTTTFAATSWQGLAAEGAATTHDGAVPPNPLGMTNCGLLGFAPEIAAQPTTSQAESPAGLDFGLDLKEGGLRSVTGTAPSDVRKVVATLPAGVTANPSAAEGLTGCSEAQYEAANLHDAGCPESSKLGSAQITSPLLEEPLAGSLYLAQPDDDSLISLYLVIRNPRFGIFVKQAGKVEPDPQTGQLVSTFDEVPQLPFSHLNLHFREGPRAPLVTPPACGSYTTTAELTPWSGGAPATAKASFDVSSGRGGGPCPSGGAPPFHPSFHGGTISNNASSYSPFFIRLTRGDGEQEITRFDAVLPPGVVGKLAGVAKCSDAAIEAAKSKTGLQELASPSCPAGSQIGRLVAGAGVGSALTYVPGRIYLAGPFVGAPLSIVAIVPAVAGPFDIGTVVTREALSLDPTTAEVKVDGAASDPIPHILKGIPLKLRDLRIYIDRPEFTVNATSCDEEHVKASLFGSFADVFSRADDVPVALTDRYQAANCSTLGFKPKLSLSLKGGTKRAAHPALHSTVTYPYPSGPGYSNIGRAVVSLPSTEIIDNAHLNNPCTRVQFNAHECPKTSVLGTARAITPLLDQPLEGPVYFRANGGEHPLPDIVADLGGEVHIVLVGNVDSVGPSSNRRLRTTFAQVPDAPVTKFTLDLFGGKRGLLVNSGNLCAKPLHAKVSLTAHNGKVSNTKPVVKTSCAKKRRR